MAMQLPGSSGGEDQMLSSINTTPLVDVMLVLLIIFLITIPVVTYSVPVDLPKERVHARESQPQDIVVSIDSAGEMYWLDSRLQSTEDLLQKLKKVALLQPQPELHIRGDLNSSYEPVGRVVYAAQRAGIGKIGFITQPPARN
ncbi:biopolymer transporter ExbD [Acidovorax sp. Root402]|uniref:ExbD/TolR family protein n=1 Tax=Acidovorax sp. Root402 TaxID=1736527 RepID=UPI0006F490B9|nr:biopolymer transporter ExbD [Acidovorax sp. Root402]KQW29992.1 biopolymer transporter ExbD [Acidovorax sp. Root402]